MDETVEITRYPNRRLYDRSQKKYVTIGDIEEMVLGGRTIRVRDSKSDEDLTRATLVQILIERHPERLKMFPLPFLHEVLRADQTALDWLAIYFGNAKSIMDNMSETGAALFPGMQFWQSVMSGMSPSPTADKTSTKSDSSAPPAAQTQENDELARRLVELEERLRRVEEESRIE